MISQPSITTPLCTDCHTYWCLLEEYPVFFLNKSTWSTWKHVAYHTYTHTAHLWTVANIVGRGNGSQTDNGNEKIESIIVLTPGKPYSITSLKMISGASHNHKHIHIITPASGGCSQDTNMLEIDIFIIIVKAGRHHWVRWLLSSIVSEATYCYNLEQCWLNKINSTLL